MNIQLLVVGRLKKGAHFDLFQDYLNRMDWTVSLHEIDSKHTDQKKIHTDETTQILAKLSNSAMIVAMDERGKTLSSRDMAAKIQDWQNDGQPNIQFIIGGADGLNDEIRARADLLLSFGKQTWPHMLARVMLLEQIYRCQQILKNHPYHRD